MISYQKKKKKKIIYNINVVLEILMHFVTFDGC